MSSIVLWIVRPSSFGAMSTSFASRFCTHPPAQPRERREEERKGDDRSTSDGARRPRRTRHQLPPTPPAARARPCTSSHAFPPLTDALRGPHLEEHRARARGLGSGGGEERKKGAHFVRRSRLTMLSSAPTGLFGLAPPRDGCVTRVTRQSWARAGRSRARAGAGTPRRSAGCAGPVLGDGTRGACAAVAGRGARVGG